jgi:molecular chaperone GrpE
VLDNLERALDHADESESLLEGVRLVHSDLMGVLQRSGVESFDPNGEPFDPTLHEALSTRPQDGQHPGTVVEVVEKGYRLNDMILRPARVVVSQ